MQGSTYVDGIPIDYTEVFDLQWTAGKVNLFDKHASCSINFPIGQIMMGF